MQSIQDVNAVRPWYHTISHLFSKMSPLITRPCSTLDSFLFTVVTWQQASLNGQLVSNSFRRPGRTFQPCAEVLKQQQNTDSNSITPPQHESRVPLSGRGRSYDRLLQLSAGPETSQSQSPTTTTPPRAPLLLRSRGNLQFANSSHFCARHAMTPTFQMSRCFRRGN